MNDQFARQKARAVGKLTEGFLLNDPSLEDLKIMNSLPDETIKRRTREIYFSGPKGKGLIKKVEGTHLEHVILWHEGWVEFFKKFGFNVDLSKFPMKPYTAGHDWTILNPNPDSFSFAWDIAKQVMPKTY